MKKYIIINVAENGTFVDDEYQYEIYFLTDEQSEGLIKFNNSIIDANDQTEALRKFKEIPQYDSIYILSSKKYYEASFKTVL